MHNISSESQWFGKDVDSEMLKFWNVLAGMNLAGAEIPYADLVEGEPEELKKFFSEHVETIEPLERKLVIFRCDSPDPNELFLPVEMLLKSMGAIGKREYVSEGEKYVLFSITKR
jgi:hypothetical protein